MKCLKCSKEFHACPSCGIGGWEWDYCSKVCWEKAGSPHYDEPAYGQPVNTGSVKVRVRVRKHKNLTAVEE